MFRNAHTFNLRNQRLWLFPEKVIYWQKRNTLLIADLHIGKSSHFRKNGIAVPGQVALSNLEVLDAVLEKTSPEHLIILGDLFHSDINQEWQQFVHWRKQYQQLEVSLVIGNHDILDSDHYHTGIINAFKKLSCGPFLLVHDVNQFDCINEADRYLLSGHVHPAVQLKGRGRQAMKLPCYYFGDQYGILPAFGEFTGTHVIEPTEDDDVFMIARSQVISAQKLKP